MQSLPHKKVPSFVPHSCHCCETLRRVDGPCHYVGDSVVTPACRQRGSCSAHRGTVVEGAQRSHSLQLIASGAWSTPLGSAKGEPAQDGRSSRPTSGRSWLCFLLCKEDRALSVVTGTHRHYYGTFGGVKEQLHSHAVLFLHYAIQALWPGVHFFFRYEKCYAAMDAAAWPCSDTELYFRVEQIVERASGSGSEMVPRSTGAGCLSSTH